MPIDEWGNWYEDDTVVEDWYDPWLDPWNPIYTDPGSDDYDPYRNTTGEPDPGTGPVAPSNDFIGSVEWADVWWALSGDDPNNPTYVPDWVGEDNVAPVSTWFSRLLNGVGDAFRSVTGGGGGGSFGGGSGNGTRPATGGAGTGADAGVMPARRGGSIMLLAAAVAVVVFVVKR